MEWLALLTDIFEVCIIPLLAVLTTYIVKYVQVKSAEITAKNLFNGLKDNQEEIHQNEKQRADLSKHR